jgi:hypothetical protein
LPFHLSDFFLLPLLFSIPATWVPILPVNGHQQKKPTFFFHLKLFWQENPGWKKPNTAKD